MAVETLRSDARRNRAAILDAAAEVFAESGLDAGVAAIARRAGVGPATLFRHFPTKDDLIVAIIEQRSETMLDAAVVALAEADTDPVGALERFLLAGAELYAKDRGFLQAAVNVDLSGEHLSEMRERWRAAVDALLDRCKAAGAVRPDLVPEDVSMCIAGVAGACVKFRDSTPGIERRYVKLALDGMRALDAGALPGPAPRFTEPTPSHPPGAARRARSAPGPKGARA